MAGTGSEMTGTAILDIPHLKFKTGIANRALHPTLGIADTEATETCPTEVHISAGLDVVSSICAPFLYARLGSLLYHWP